MQIRQSPLNTDVDARIRYTFDPKEGGTFLNHRLVLTFNLHGTSRLVDRLTGSIKSIRKKSGVVVIILAKDAKRADYR